MNDAALISLQPAKQEGRAPHERRGVAHRVYAVDLSRSHQVPPPALISWIVAAGFDILLLSLPRSTGTADISALPPIAAAAVAAGLRVHIDLVLDAAHEQAPAVRLHPEWYRALARRAADPRATPSSAGLHRIDVPVAAIEPFVEFWTGVLTRFGKAGISGFRCKPSPHVPPEIWRQLIAAAPAFAFSVWTPGLAAEDVGLLPRESFDLAYNSLAWWDFGAGWFRAEAARLAPVAAVANTIAWPNSPGPVPLASTIARRMLRLAANSGHGLLLPMGFEFGLASDPDYPVYGSDDWQRLTDHALISFADLVREANDRAAGRTATSAAPEILSSDDAQVAVLFEPPARLTLANRRISRSSTFDPAGILPIFDGRLSGFAEARDGHKPRALETGPLLLAPGEVRVFEGAAATPVAIRDPVDGKRRRDAADAKRAAAAAAVPRVAIETITPSVDGGRFPVKRVVGQRVTVAADIFSDGHGKIAAALQWRARDEADWREAPMRLVENDRWSAAFPLERAGDYLFRIAAWPDRYETWRDELIKKRDAGLDVTLELEEGKRLVEAIAAAASGTLDPLLGGLKGRKGRKAPDRAALLTADAAAELIRRADPRPGQAVSAELPVQADRTAAEFAAWYELFPRNQGEDASRHGGFRDVIPVLPAIRDMGFDVLYFPPIHPIGRTNRKGRDNTLTPAPDDPGSPYAIGSADGGHDAIHPELGTIDDFRALREAAGAHGLELALDFAIQCSPDHPWLKEHPGWFDWRPDGGLRYAENPPKKYEDIVNVDFYAKDAVPALWLALRDAVAYWAGEGVRIFRVDNPHTKPFPFWEWLIADIRARYPGTLFLAEAFTRPKVMQRLARLGFSQSYTYFTWRNEKREIEAYLTELTAPDVADFFRPNFFVNTPDINPVFLQHSGRAGFLIRAALAATLSGLWGMLQGFEFCEAAAVAGREEYAHSDKYEIRHRPARAPGDIVDEITRLNAIRRANPALRSHRGLAFQQAWNDRVIWFRKANADRSNVLLIAISLDPFAAQTASVEVPLWEWGLTDGASLAVHDLLTDSPGIWTGKYRTITLDPRTIPFGIWRARPLEDAL